MDVLVLGRFFQHFKRDVEGNCIEVPSEPVESNLKSKALHERGELHATVDSPKMYRQRSVEIILPRGVDWFEATENHRRSDGNIRIANFVTAEMV